MAERTDVEGLLSRVAFLEGAMSSVKSRLDEVEAHLRRTGQDQRSMPEARYGSDPYWGYRQWQAGHE
jgi:hypothetical protein